MQPTTPNRNHTLASAFRTHAAALERGGANPPSRIWTRTPSGKWTSHHATPAEIREIARRA